MNRRFEELGLGRVRGDLEQGMRPSIRLQSRSGPVGVGGSKLGGLPDLPDRAEWPHKGSPELPLHFIGQINLAEVARFDTEKLLPEKGLLSFFYDAEQQPWGFDPNDAGGWQVLYTEDLATLRPAEAPTGLHLFQEVGLIGEVEQTLLPREGPDLVEMGLTDPEIDAYFTLMEGESTYHRLLGHPQQVQGEMRLKCQLASNGLFCGDETGYRDPRAEQLTAGATDWLLLFQVDSDLKQAGMMWGDMGRLYYWIRRQDLAQRRFDKVWLVLQCS